ncbi:MAG TPA: PaaI family thioesterase [Acidimicrobiales bacterium]|jgi:acyl-coenzyme A thioesterase PaaI-like protein
MNDSGGASPTPSEDGSERTLGTPGSAGWTDMLNSYASEAPSPRRVELHRTGDALRRIVHRLHGSRAEADELAEVADELEALAQRLDNLTAGSMYEGFGESPLAGQDPHAFFDHSPMLGRANPLAPPLMLWAEDEVMHGLATFDAAYEGPPGCVHGGYIAAAFDEVLGSTQSLAGQPGMTGRLTVNYRSPTPLRTELRFTARVVEVSGRKTFTHGTLHAGDRLCAEAEGLFISIDIGKMVELRAEREKRFGS